MPIYEYKCKGGGNKFEALVLNRDDKVSCPKCKKSNLDKLFSTFASIMGKNENMPQCSSGACPHGGCPTGTNCPSNI